MLTNFEKLSLNKVEIIKKQKDGLEIINDLKNNPSIDFKAIPNEELELLKWLGLYEQNSKDGHFMLRVRIPSGILNSEQAMVLAQIARECGHNIVDLTTRQALQFHWVRLEHMPEILKKLETVGLSPFEACGDCPRNITGNPLAGIDPNELMDTTKIVKDVEEYFLLNKAYSNLPRKFKISISANIYNNGLAEINDLAFTPAIKRLNGKDAIGFHVWVGGGLSHTPQLAQCLNMFVTPDDIVKVASGVAKIFRDYGYRNNRSRARLKYLIMDWGIEKFERYLREAIGEFPEQGEDKIIDDRDTNYLIGINEQKQKGLYYLSLQIPRGRMTAEDIEKAASLANVYGNSSIRLTTAKKIIITHIKKGNLENVLQADIVQRYNNHLKSFQNNGVCCTGKEFCSKAIVRTKPWLQIITDYLDKHFNLELPIRVYMSGCASSCGQTQIADIGLQGSVIKTKEGIEEAFEIYLGGQTGPKVILASKLKGRISAQITPKLVAEFIRLYLSLKNNNETFNDCITRIGFMPFQEKLDDLKAKTIIDKTVSFRNIV